MDFPSHRLSSTLQSWHFDAEPSRGSPFHSLNRTPAGGLSPARRSPVIFLAAAAVDELLRRKWNGLFGNTFAVYYGWFSGIYAVQYLFDLLLFGLVGSLIGFLFPSPASTRWAVGLGIFFGFARSLQFTHDFTAAARWHDYAAAYGQYFIPPVAAYLGVVISRLRKAPSHESGAA